MIRRLGEKVRQLREGHGLSQSELAARIGMSDRSKGYISEIESGKKLPSLPILLGLATFFEVTTDYLLKDDLTAPEAISQRSIDTLATSSPSNPTEPGSD